MYYHAKRGAVSVAADSLGKVQSVKVALEYENISYCSVAFTTTTIKNNQSFTIIRRYYYVQHQLFHAS